MTTPRTTTSFEERVGLVLVEGGFLTRQQLTKAQEASQILDTRLLDTLVFSGILSQETLVTVLSFQLRIPVVDLRHTQVDPEALRLIPEWYAWQNAAMPLGFDTDGSLRVATKMPNDFKLCAEFSLVAGRQAKFVLGLGGGLKDLIRKAYASMAVQGPVSVLITGVTTAISLTDREAFLDQNASQLLAAQVVDMVTLQAIKGGASEIYLVPNSSLVWMLFRLKGKLQQMVVLPLALYQSMVSWIRVQAKMDITKTRGPQDGTFNRTYRMLGERSMEFHVSYVGADWGEILIIRIL